MLSPTHSELAKNTLAEVVKIRATNQYSQQHVMQARYVAWMRIIDESGLPEAIRGHYSALVECLYGQQRQLERPQTHSAITSAYCASQKVGL